MLRLGGRRFKDSIEKKFTHGVAHYKVLSKVVSIKSFMIEILLSIRLLLKLSGSPLTVSLHEAFRPFAVVTVSVAFPSFFAVMVPDVLIVATLVLSDFQV